MKWINTITIAGLVFCFGFSAQAGPKERIDNCGNDVGCIAKVLVDVIEYNDGGGGGSQNYVEFYHDDGQCYSGNLIAKVPDGVSDLRCERLAEGVRDRVWGIKLYGDCMDISDSDFVSACKRFASRGLQKNKANVKKTAAQK